MTTATTSSVLDRTTLKFQIEHLEHEIESGWADERAQQIQHLRKAPIKQRLEGWWLARLPGTPVTPGIVGWIVRTHAGQTSSVVDIDAETRRIRTRSGSVYELGIPESLFARRNAQLLRELGLR